MIVPSFSPWCATNLAIWFYLWLRAQHQKIIVNKQGTVALDDRFVRSLAPTHIMDLCHAATDFSQRVCSNIVRMDTYS